jgi:hypothetical protein
MQGCATPDEVEAMSVIFPVVRALAASALHGSAESRYFLAPINTRALGRFLGCARLYLLGLFIPSRLRRCLNNHRCMVLSPLHGIVSSAWYCLLCMVLSPHKRRCANALAAA